MKRLTVCESAKELSCHRHISIKRSGAEGACAATPSPAPCRENKKAPMTGLVTGDGVKNNRNCRSGAQSTSHHRKKSPIRLKELSPEKPLFKLGNRDIYAEDILLILLLIVLSEEDADPAVIIAIGYVLLSGWV